MSYKEPVMESLLKIRVDIPCQVFCDCQLVGDASPDSLCKVYLRKGVYFLQFKAEGKTLLSREYIIAEDDYEYLLCVSLEKAYAFANREEIAQEIAALDVELENHGGQWTINKSDGTKTELPFEVSFYPEDDPIGYHDPNKESIDSCGLISAFKLEEGTNILNGHYCGHWGCFNKKGEVQIPFIYEEKVHFENSEVAVARLDGESLFINKWGEIAFDNPFDYVDDYHGIFCVVEVHDKYGVINQYGDFIIPPIYDDICIKGDPDFVLLIQKGEKFGVLRDVNDEIIAIQYDEILLLGNDSLRVFIVKKGNHFELLNKDGQTVFESNNEIRVIDSEYNYSSYPFFYVKEENKCGVIRFDGRVIVPLDFDEIKPYLTYECQLSKDSVSFAVKRGDSYGLYSQDGEIVVPVEYDNIEKLDYNSQSFVITKDGRKGLCHNGHLSIPPTFTSITKNDFNYSVVFVESDEGKKGMLRLEDGSAFIPVQFDDITSFETRGPKPNHWITRLYIVNENTHWGVYNNDGSCIFPVIYDSIEMPNPDTIIVSKDGELTLYNSGDGFQKGISIVSFESGWKEQLIVFRSKSAHVYDGSRYSITTPHYDYIIKAEHGLCYIVEINGKYGLINSNGKCLCEPEYDGIFVGSDYIIMGKDQKLIMTDYKWNKIPTPDYRFPGLVYAFDSRKDWGPVVEKDGKWGCLNNHYRTLASKDDVSSIHELIPCEYDYVSTDYEIIPSGGKETGEVTSFIKKKKHGVIQFDEYQIIDGHVSLSQSYLGNNPFYKYIFIDTETTGLPRDPYASPYELKNWPRIVQISWIITDAYGHVLLKDNYIIKPSGFSIPKQATKIHGIDNQRAALEGKPIEFVLNKLIEDCNGVNCLVGYNISFDEHVIDAELIRANLPLVFEEMETFCVMKSFGVFFNSGDGNGARWHYPSLEDLYLQFFNHFLSNAHNSASDIQATMEIFWKMRGKEIESSKHPEEIKENGDDDDVDADLPF